VLDFDRKPGDPHGPREAELPALADAAVVVWDEAAWLRVAGEGQGEGIPVHVLKPADEPQ
jgi:hypothetical protein